MINIKETIIVEGKYDKIKLSTLFNTMIISTGGFSIFTNREKQKLIRDVAGSTGIIIFTDSDMAGFLIRNFIVGCVDNEFIKHAYIPQIEGKEKRKAKTSKAGFLGVEGIDNSLIIKAIENVSAIEKIKNENPITKTHLYDDGLIGHENSANLRERIIDMLQLPKGLSTNALIQILNCIYSYDEYKGLIKNL